MFRGLSQWLSYLSQWLLSSSLIYLLFSQVTHGNMRKLMPQRLHLAFKRQQPLYCLQQASLKGKEPHRQVMEQEKPAALGQIARGRSGRKETSSSQHICLHLCLSEEKPKYLLLENKGEKEPVNISQLRQEPKDTGVAFAVNS